MAVQTGAEPVIRPALTEQEARQLTDAVKRDLAATWVNCLDLYEGQAHLALGYGSWRAYWEAEFGQSGTRGEQLVRAGRVARALTEAGMKPPANDTVARQLLPVLRKEPERLPDIWAQALEMGAGRPSGREVQELVETIQPTERSAAVSQRGLTRRTRNTVGAALKRAHVSADAAAEALDQALATDPGMERLVGWLLHAEEALEALEDVIARLEAAGA